MADDLPHLAAYIEQCGTPATKADAIAERNAWIESAAQFSRSEDYYRGLLDEIATAIGPEAWKADNGDIVDDEPVRARLPNLVAARITELESALREIAEYFEDKSIRSWAEFTRAALKEPRT